jgi:hypothetical protein
MRNLTEYIDYFRVVAQNHKLIKHSTQTKRFVRVNLFELDNSLSVSMNYPLLALEKPYFQSGGDSRANMRWNKVGALLIMDKVGDKGNFDAQHLAENKCVEIAMDIAAKMEKDARLYVNANKDFFLSGLDHDSFTIEVLPAPLHGFLYGCRLSFRWNDPAPRFDISKWDNETDYSI